jgi:hypothetical protein
MRRSVVVHERGRIAVEVATHPLEITVRRDGRGLVGPIAPHVRDGEIGDQFIQLTEGVVAHEDLGDPLVVTDAHAEGDRFVIALEDGTRATLAIALPAHDRVLLELTAAANDAPVRRLGLTWPGHAEQRLTGLGARHGLHVDQAGRTVSLGADRRYTGPNCPADMPDLGSIPQGDYAPVPWLISSRGWAAWLQTDGPGAQFVLGDEIEISARAAAGPLRLHLLCHPTPAAQLRAFLTVAASSRRRGRTTRRPAAPRSWRTRRSDASPCG